MSKKDLSKYFDPDVRMKRHLEKRAQFSQVSDVFKRSKVRESNLTTQNAGPRAVQLVREVLNNYNMQTPPKLSYSGVRDMRVASNSSKIENGVVTINAQIKSPSSVNIQFDVPVEIHQGEMLEPAIIVVAGAPKVISQSTFDTLLQENSIWGSSIKAAVRCGC
jgi:hypothetical protein